MVLAKFNWAQLAKLVAMILAVQAIYWFGIDKPLFRADPGKAPPQVEILSAEIARLNAPTFEAAANASYKPIELKPAGTMWTHCCDTAIFAVRMTFELDRIPADGLGIFSLLEVDNYKLAVNNNVLFSKGRLQVGGGTFHGQIRNLTRVPSGLLRAGENEITYITVRDGFPYTDIVAPEIGEYAAMDEYAGRKLFFASDFPLMTGVVFSLLGLLASIMVFRSDDWRFAAWLSLLCAALCANSIYRLWLDPPVDGWGRMVMYFAIFQLIPTSLLCFIDSWTQRPLPWLQRIVSFAYLLTLAIITWSIYRVAMPDGFGVPVSIWRWYLMAAAVAVVARLLWHFATSDETRLVESGLLSVMGVALALDAFTSAFPQLGIRYGNVSNASSFLLLAMIVAFITRNFRLFQSQGALASLLQTKVEQREAELAVAHAREQQLVSKQAHDDERRRIMRDLHDGLGSQLMSMMLAARLGEADPPKVAEGLQGVIDEMRLMVDSMDSVGESLDAALATFRARVQPRIQAAGFGFHWTQPESIDLPGYGPRDVLQIFRILQEAVTNALKHSGGDAITIDIVQSSQDNLQIRIADNGKGGANVGDAGRGLANMQSRARAVKAGFAVESPSGGGTAVTLSLPRLA
jgi:two-component system, NarL family, sensor histidine kinase UhpB